MPYSGWKVEESDREMLLRVFPPLYPDVIAHHVTNNLKQEIPEDANIVVVGYCNDDDGVECLIVSVNGSKIRPDGSTYHITLSIDRAAGKKPVDSNEAIKNNFCFDIAPIAIRTVPFCVDKTGKEIFTIA